jgi:hypothetical protein
MVEIICCILFGWMSFFVITDIFCLFSVRTKYVGGSGTACGRGQQLLVVLSYAYNGVTLKLKIHLHLLPRLIVGAESGRSVLLNNPVNSQACINSGVYTLNMSFEQTLSSCQSTSLSTTNPVRIGAWTYWGLICDSSANSYLRCGEAETRFVSWHFV